MKRLLVLSLILIFILSGCRKSNVDDSGDISSTVQVISSSEQSLSSVTESEPSAEPSSVGNSVSSAEEVPSSKVSSSSSTASPSSAVSSQAVPAAAKPSADIGIKSGVWLSFLEINTLLKSKNGFKYEFDKVAEKLYGFGINELYFHVRSHCDSVVKSKYFPRTDASKTVNYDILDYVISACHKKGIKVYAWINPYRVTASHSDISKLPEGSPALKWLSDGDSQNDRNVVVMNGIYLNPAESEVRKLVLDGVRELVKNYDLDGIHFDDYFYPTTNPDFDKVSYENYKDATENPLSLADWRRKNVNTLIAETGTAVKSAGKNMIFSVSPAANIEKNYNSAYADVKYWIDNGLVDEVIPQIYFGFNHTDRNFNFDKLLKEWLKFCENSKARLKIGLASYKIGTESDTDGDEWQKNNDILARQVALCKQNSKIAGVVFYSYTSLFSPDKPNTLERNNLGLK